VRILGLDPGSRFTGFGLLDRRGSRLRHVAHGRVTLPSTDPLPKRLARLCSELSDLLHHYEPEAIVLESLFRGINAKSLIVLAQARGALLATIAQVGGDIYEYSPAEVKAAVTGNGRAEKEQVSRMVKLILGLKNESVSVDASDALAVAICFAQRLKLDRLGAKG